jgi:hypothetical protein
MSQSTNTAKPDLSLPVVRTCRLGWAVVLCALLLQFWSRYLPSPWAVLVADDWSNLARSSLVYASHFDAIRGGLQDTPRPLSMVAVNLGYRIFGAHALFWTLLSLAANSLLLLAIMKMALELTGRRWIAATTGVVFALLPNLTETYHWSTQVLNEVSCALVPYALSGWMWVAYLRRGGAWRLAVSALAYGVGLFSYEAGIFLPVAYLVLLPWKKVPFKSVLRLLPLGLVGLLYLAWRGTNAFGLNQPVNYPPHMQVGPSLLGVTMNTWYLIHWWIGENMFGAMLSGFQSFATMSVWTRRLLFVADVGVVFLAGWGLRRLANAKSSENTANPFSGIQVVGFALAWTGAAWAISLASYTGGRLNVIPAIGVSLLVALALGWRSNRKWGLALFLPAVLAMMANQGTAESYRQAGALNQGLYSFLRESVDEWRDKEILLIDTRALRQRLTPGLLKPAGEDQATWANYGNALLLRGFTANGMVKLVAGRNNPWIFAIHDVEYGARIEGDQLIWHDRYDPSRPHTNSMSDVFVVDCLAVAQAEYEKSQRRQ